MAAADADRVVIVRSVVAETLYATRPKTKQDCTAFNATAPWVHVPDSLSAIIDGGSLFV